MKRFVFLVMLLFFVTATVSAGITFFADFTFSFMVPADTAYKTLYGESVFYPEVKAGVRIFNNIYAWGGLGIIEAEGSYPVEEEERTAISSQQYYSLGLGIEFMVSKKLSVKADGGLVFVNHRGQVYTSNLEVKDDRGTKLGYKFDMGLYYNFSNRLNAGLSLGYFHGQNTTDYQRKVSYGGLKTGLALGIRF